MFVEIVTIGSFVAIAITVCLLADMLVGGRRNARLAVDTLGEAGSTASIRSVASPISQALAAIVPQSAGELTRIDRDLKRAGYYKNTALTDYLASRNTLVVLCLIATGSIAVFVDPGTSLPPTIMIIGIVVALLGYSFPRIVLSSQAKRRVGKIQKGLPAALDIVTMCITRGLPLRDALDRVSGEIRFSQPEIAVEFDILKRHAEANTMKSALRQFADRIDVPDVSALAALVSQTERLGTHVATAICDYSDTVRRKHQMVAEERANKTTIRLLFPVIFCLAPPIYILLCGPPVLKLRDFVLNARQPGGVMDTESFDEDYVVPENAGPGTTLTSAN